MRVGLCQLNTTPDPVANLILVGDGVRRCADAGADVVVFPEATMARFGTPLGSVAEPVEGPWADRVRAIADAAGVLVVAGMFTPSPDGRVRNTLLLTGRGVDTSYDKIHLFDAFGFTESATVAPGDKPVTFRIDNVTFGVATCYDLRFPELFTVLAQRGATAILVAASWGAGPGKREQWELLVRARALDCTSWVLACGQADPRASGVSPPAGRAPTGIGHSMVVGPTGVVTEELDAGPADLVTDLSLAEVVAARESVPVLSNHRM
jgi:predicted amidohydrolase